MAGREKSGRSANRSTAPSGRSGVHRGRVSRRDELLAAALRLFSTRGMKDTSIRDITGAVGVTEAALYRHWKNKQALAEDLVEQAAGELTALLESAVERAETPRQRLGAMVDALFAFHTEQREKFDLVVHVVHFEPAMVGRRAVLPSTVVLPLLEAGIKSKSFRKTEPQLALALIIGTVARTTQLMRMGLVKGSATRTARQVREMILQALAA